MKKRGTVAALMGKLSSWDLSQLLRDGRMIFFFFLFPVVVSVPLCAAGCRLLYHVWLDLMMDGHMETIYASCRNYRQVGGHGVLFTGCINTTGVFTAIFI